ncbi:ABC transporter ATP-binding protein [Streptomyces caeruleatus]|uniref:Multidrug ABC transporter permease n=1 Tax=Streptomyces caeruleatus TaxID=661399 RepID=A0A101TNR3_9ACTN|nr:ABC transporter ATP-binding protein [Streptomyces caeruleatus]KUN95722.1 multidrug ABC transporter permease [Streptomyces caeruleatus]
MHHFPEPDPGRPDLRSPQRYLLWLATRHPAAASLAVVHGVLCTLAQALVPYAVGQAVDQGLVDQDKQALVLWSGVVMGLGVVQAITGTLRDRCSLTNRFGAAFRTMQLVTRKAAGLGAELPRRASAGSVVSVGATDITRIGAALESTARGGGAVVSIVVVAVLMLTLSWQLGLVALLGVPLIAWGVARLMRLLHGHQQNLRQEQGALTDLSVDIIEGLRVLRGIGGEEIFAGRYRERSQRVRHEGVRVATVEASVVAGRLLFPGLLVTAIVWLGAHFVATGRMSAGALIAFYGYAVFLAEQLRRATTMVDQLTRAVVSCRRVVDLLLLERALTSGDRDPAELSARADLSDPASGLRITPGRLTAVACASAGDAHALADRVGRYEDSGAAYNGVPLSAYPLAAVRRKIMVVDHEARLFSGELGAELSSGPGTAAADLDTALDVASANDIVEALPDGLSQEISGSREFSGGQQQRLLLARALAHDPDVLVLVEPTSALDAHTEARVAARLARHRDGRSTVVFTTSPMVLDQADHVVYVEDGRVAAEGSHGELLRDARYRSVVTREVSVS